MGIFGSKSTAWVPVNEKLMEKCEVADSQWAAKESFVGWRVMNDGKLLMSAIAKCETCSNFDLSYNGLGDNEAKELGKALVKSNTRNKKPYAPTPGANIFGTIVKLNLSNNHIHGEGIKAIIDAFKCQPRVLCCLEEINFANNHAGHVGADAIAQVMKGNKVLTRINLANNHIQNQGLKSLVSSVGAAHTKGKIIIQYNLFDLAELDLREWFGDDMLSPVKLLKRLGVDTPNNLFVGWDQCGLNDVVPA